MRDRFYDPKLKGLDWPAMRDRFRPQAEAAGSLDELSTAINAMLAELGASHTRYYTIDDPAYYQLADIFAGSLRHQGLSRIFANGDVTYPGIGVFTQTDDRGRTFVTGVIEGALGIGPVSSSATKSCRRTNARSDRSPRSAAGSELRCRSPSGGRATERRRRFPSRRPIFIRTRCF